MKINFRDATEKDIAFITSTWLNACWNSKKYKDMKKSVFMEGHHKAIQKRINSFSCVVASDPSDPYVIYGYIIYNRPHTLHFAYVKGNFREFGVCKQLVKEAFGKDLRAIQITHQTEYSSEIGKKWELEYNPYKFYEAGA